MLLITQLFPRENTNRERAPENEFTSEVSDIP